MGNSSKNQPTVAIDKWLSEGRTIHKRHRFTFFFASIVGTITCTPLSVFIIGIVGSRLWMHNSNAVGGSGAFAGSSQPWIFAPLAIISVPLLVFLFGPLYAGLCFMGLKSMRGEKPRIRDIFMGFDRFWGTCFLWLIVPVGVFILVSTVVGVLLVPLLWATAMLAFPLLIDQQLGVFAAMSTAFRTVLTWKNWWRFWFFGLVLTFLGYTGIVVFGIGIFVTLPLAICVQMIAYREIFKPQEVLLNEVTKPGDQYPSMLKGKYIQLISQIRELRDRIFEAIDSANEGVQPLLESSIEHIGGVVSKAAELINRLQQIEDYLQTSSIQTLCRERDDIEGKLSTANNAAVALQYEEALKTLKDRLANHEHLTNFAAQIRAQLTTIRISLDNALAKIVRIKTTEVGNASFESDDVSKELQSLRIEMDALLDSLNEMEGGLPRS
ncbi:MAG: hypothetical protein OXN17_01995 [Candidatus Poribacteria bacterium]|nr:hypothetical protein [Candidatus Poribacteria bacterium]MDE0502786.1 hypothetical protein [Candidatus Poribacteria bacterium]